MWSWGILHSSIKSVIKQWPSSLALPSVKHQWTFHFRVTSTPLAAVFCMFPSTDFKHKSMNPAVCMAWPRHVSDLVCRCVLALASFHPQALHHQTQGVATRWLNKHITQLPITQIHLAPLVNVSLTRPLPPPSDVSGGRKGAENERRMRIWGKFLPCVFYFNQ